jgi:hypothetical protein
LIKSVDTDFRPIPIFESFVVPSIVVVDLMLPFLVMDLVLIVVHITWREDQWSRLRAGSTVTAAFD